MNREDIPELAAKLAEAYEFFGKEFPNGNLKIWSEQFAPYQLDVVLKALDIYVGEGKFVPQPGDIKAIIRANDGHPGPQEAWLIGKLLTDQKASAWSTHQINEASDEVKYLIDEDPIAARKVFIECYERLVAKARREGEAAQWHVSEGDDYEGRKVAYMQAMHKGLIKREQIERKYPEMLYDAPEQNLLVDGVVKLLGKSKRMNASDEERKRSAEAVRKHFAELRKQLSTAGLRRD